MNNKIATGIWLVFGGALFLLYNFNLIDFSFVSILRLWPLLLVSMGINLLLQNRQNSKLLVIISNILLCGFVFYHGLTDNAQSRSSNWSNAGNEQQASGYNEQVSQGWNSEIRSAELTLSGGASKYDFKAGADSTRLIEAETRQPSGALKLKSSGEQNVRMELTSSRPNRGSNVPISIALNKSPIWNFVFNVGASSISGDLRELRIGDIELNSGASSLELHLPTPNKGTSHIEINTAASKIKLYIPKDAHCRVETESIVSNNKYEGLDVVDGNERKTNGYDSADDKYDIEVSGAANSVSILRY